MRLRRTVTRCVAGLALWHTLVGQDVVYQVPYISSATLNDRIKPVVQFEACGNELVFFRRSLEKDVSEDILAPVIAKMLWVARRLNPRSEPLFPYVCTGEILMPNNAFKKPSDIKPDDHPKLTTDDLADLTSNNGKGLNSQIAALFLNCPNMITNAAVPSDGVVRIQYRVTAACMVTEINVAINRMAVIDQAGSSGLPCYVLGPSTSGEWDVKVRDLTRIFYLNRRLGGGILDVNTRDHIFNDLLTLDGPPDSDTYPLLSCGNQEQSTGPPEDRADSNTWTNRTFDALSPWLLWLLLILALLALLIVAAIVSPALAVALGIALAAGSTLLLESTRLPETENHRLMIESSRYLADQYIVQALRDQHHPDADTWADYLQDVKDYLIDRCQRVLKEDFIEYNAKPYGRYSINAILNLYDFADDPDVRTAAEALLTYTSAKFAIGSNEGRRIVPWRRRMQGMLSPRTDMTLLADYADHMMAFMLLQLGQVQQLPTGSFVQPDGTTKTLPMLATGAPQEMIYSASSRYRLEDIAPIVLELARPSDTYDQRIHHAGIEIYSGARDYLITAGGIQTDFPYSVGLLFGLIGTGGIAQDNSDLGAAPPTTFMPARGVNQHDWTEFLRFEGEYISYKLKDDNNPVGYSFDGNTCVWKGFACGLEPKIPDLWDNNACLNRDVDGWQFVDSSVCPILSNPVVSTKFYLVFYQTRCTTTDYGCRDKWGFLEAVQSPVDDFATFQSKVKAANPSLNLDSSKMTGTYHSVSGHTIDFAASPRVIPAGTLITGAIGPRQYGILAIDSDIQPDLNDWDHADGAYMHAKKDEAFVRIDKGSHWVELDLRSTPKITFKYN